MDKHKLGTRVLTVCLVLVMLAGIALPGIPSLVSAAEGGGSPSLQDDTVETRTATITWSGFDAADMPSEATLRLKSDDGSYDTTKTVTAPGWTATWDDVPVGKTYALSDASGANQDWTVSTPSYDDAAKSYSVTFTKRTTASPGDGDGSYDKNHVHENGTCGDTSQPYLTCGQGGVLLLSVKPQADGGKVVPDQDYVVKIEGQGGISYYNRTFTIPWKNGASSAIEWTGLPAGTYKLVFETTDDIREYGYKGVSYPAASNGTFTIKALGQNDDPVHDTHGTEWNCSQAAITVVPSYEIVEQTYSVKVDWSGYTEDEIKSKSVQLQLYRSNGTAYGSAVTVNAASGWEYTWNGLTYDTYNAKVVTNGNPEWETVYGAGDGTHDMVITNVKPGQNANVTVSLKWEGFEEGESHKSVKVALVDSSGETVDTKLLTKSGGWTYTWQDIERDTYSIEILEGADDCVIDMDVDVNNNTGRMTFTITATKSAGIGVNVVWSGFGSTTPATSVQVQLYDEQGKAVGKPVTLDSKTGWTYEWEGVVDGTYTVRQLTEGNWITSITQSGSMFTITNSAAMTVNVNLTWAGYSNNEYPVDSVNVALVDSYGNRVDTIRLTSYNGWTGSFANMPVDDYSVVELTTGNWVASYKSSGGSSSSSSSSSSASKNMTWTITNTKEKTTTVVAKLTWSGYSSAADYPATGVLVRLYDATYRKIGEDVMLRASNGWTYTWRDLPAGDYYVEEITEGPWIAEYSQSGAGTSSSGSTSSSSSSTPSTITWTIKNTKTNTAKATVRVVWSGFAASDTKPAYVEVQLTQNGQKVGESAILTSGNNWTYTWNDLEAGAVYMMQEVTTGNWDATYSQSGTTWTITNTKNGNSTDTGTTQTPPTGTGTSAVQPGDTLGGGTTTTGTTGTGTSAVQPGDTLGSGTSSNLTLSTVPKTGDPILRTVGLVITLAGAAILVYRKKRGMDIW